MNRAGSLLLEEVEDDHVAQEAQDVRPAAGGRPAGSRPPSQRVRAALDADRSRSRGPLGRKLSQASDRSEGDRLEWPGARRSPQSTATQLRAERRQRLSALMLGKEDSVSMRSLGSAPAAGDAGGGKASAARRASVVSRLHQGAQVTPAEAAHGARAVLRSTSRPELVDTAGPGVASPLQSPSAAASSATSSGSASVASRKWPLAARQAGGESEDGSSDLAAADADADTDEDMRTLARSRGLLLPDSAARWAWEAAMTLWVLFYSLGTPLRIAFSGRDTPALAALDAAGWVFAVADVALTFNTGLSRHGEVILDRGEVRRSYCRGWLAVDLLGLVPLDEVAWHVAAQPVAPLLRLTRCWKLFRMLRARRILRRWEEAAKVNPSALRLAKLLALLALMWHWIGCSYWLVSEAEGHAAGDPFFQRDGGNLWVPPEELWCEREQECPALSECFAGGACPAPLGRRYLFALFWAVMTSTGVGRDVEPVSATEHVFTVAMIAVGLFANALLIGSASSALSALDATSAERRNRLEAVAQYLRQRGVPKPLQRRVRSFFEYMWSSHGALAADAEDGGVLDGLHPSLRLELSLCLNQRLLREVPMFRMLSDSECIVDIIDKLRPRIFIPGEFVVLEGEMGHEMFVLVRGRVRVLVGPEQRCVDEVGDGQVFGERALITRERRNASIRAVTYCDMMVLSRGDFDDVLRLYPEFARSVHQVAARQYGSGWTRLSESLRMASARRVLGGAVDLRDILLGEPSSGPAPRAAAHVRPAAAGAGPGAASASLRPRALSSGSRLGDLLAHEADASPAQPLPPAPLQGRGSWQSAGSAPRFGGPAAEGAGAGADADADAERRRHDLALASGKVRHVLGR